METHSLDPAKVLRLVRRMGGRIDRLLLVGCEPSPLDADDMCQGLSMAVAAAVDEAVRMVQELIEKICEARLSHFRPRNERFIMSMRIVGQHPITETILGVVDRRAYRGVDRAGFYRGP